MNQYTYMTAIYRQNMQATGYLNWLFDHGRNGWHLCARDGDSHVFARKLEQKLEQSEYERLMKTTPQAEASRLREQWRKEHGVEYPNKRTPSLASVLHDMRNLDLPALEALQESVQNQITIARMVKAKP